ncbi:MAG: ZIP family metal transporter [Candidatus Margulisiibacteriota bacterium]
MLNTWLFSLSAVILISLVSLIGVLTLLIKRQKLTELLTFLVSFAVGGLFGDALIHLIPEAFREIKPQTLVPFLILAGILMFFVLEKFIRWRHCHFPAESHHPHPVVTMNLIGDGAHNLIDGMIIGASFLVSPQIGVATTLAVLLHEIPQEIGDFGILIHGGLSVRRALAWNFISALFAVLGAIISLIVGPLASNYSLYVLPITAGGFIYMAGSDLIPSLHDRCEATESGLQFVSILLGIGVMAGLLLVG